MKSLKKPYTILALIWTSGLFLSVLLLDTHNDHSHSVLKIWHNIISRHILHLAFSQSGLRGDFQPGGGTCRIYIGFQVKESRVHNMTREISTEGRLLCDLPVCQRTPHFLPFANLISQY